MLHITNEKDCCGCGACSVACPVGAINMKPFGTLGAVLPQVDENKCISCGVCLNTCPIINSDKDKEPFRQNAYAAYSKNEDLRFKSSSGGMFLTFAEKCVADGYKVYGAAFNSKMQLRCERAETVEELLPLARSKYLQSELTDKYNEIENSLKSGEKILFISTPCQVSALKRFLKREYDNLLTVDFFCHGVPSQSFFDECIRFEDNKRSRKTSEFVFRAKVKNGVTPHYYKIKYEKNGKKVEKIDIYYKSLFYALFQQYITLRESCYNCVFADKDRSSDITIGDFHEIDNYIQGINRFDGISTVIVNSAKGEKLLESVRSALEIYEINIEKLIEDKVIFCGATKRPSARDEFLNVYDSRGLDGVSKKYCGIKKYYKQAVYYRMPKPVRSLLKKFL